MKSEGPGLHRTVLDKHLPPKKLCAAMRATSLTTTELQPSPSVKHEGPGLHCTVFDKLLPPKSYAWLCAALSIRACYGLNLSKLRLVPGLSIRMVQKKPDLHFTIGCLELDVRLRM